MGLLQDIANSSLYRKKSVVFLCIILAVANITTARASEAQSESTGTGSLYGIFYQTSPTDQFINYHLTNVDPTTGTLTPIGPNFPSAPYPGEPTALDAAGHRYFMTGYDQSYHTAFILTIDTQTGAVTASQPLPTGQNLLDLQYAPIVSNTPPMVNSLSNATITEGDTYSTYGLFTDPDSTSWTATVDYGDGSGVQSLALSGMTFALNHLYVEEGTYTMTVTVTDTFGSSGTGSATVTVTNAPFTVSGIAAPMTPTPVNTSITASASFTDPGVLDTHTAVWSWGDGTTSQGTVTEANGSGSVQASHTYTAAGVYTVNLTVTDDDGASVAAPPFQYVVVYDPTAGFVTGGGWYTLPAGAYPANPSASGKLQFGFDVKYQAGASVPSGSTQLTFQECRLSFQSTSYQWLVIAAASAQFKGTGTINGSGNYTFLVTLVDGGKTGPSLIRIKIWETATGTIIYDSQPGAPDTATPTTAIGAGNLKIH